MSLEKSTNVAFKFSCKICDYFTDKKTDYNKHVYTIKHQKLVNASKMLENANQNVDNPIFEYNCQCGKKYSHNSSYYRHKKLCNQDKPINFEGKDKDEIIIMLIKQNAELIKTQQDVMKGQQDITMEIMKNGTNNTTTNTNSHNKTFNLQLFLNETCKDAMNIDEFVSSIKVSLDDLENTGRKGYIEGISNIILKHLNNLEQQLRPVHCSDSKREIFYIKDNNEWIKENTDKPVLTKAIKLIANENIKQIKYWQERYPDCRASDSKKNNLYLKIVSNSMNGLTEEESNKNIEKIISNVAKEVSINKYK
jgi:hypothetical protein